MSKIMTIFSKMLLNFFFKIPLVCLSLLNYLLYFLLLFLFYIFSYINFGLFSFFDGLYLLLEFSMEEKMDYVSILEYMMDFNIFYCEDEEEDTSWRKPDGAWSKYPKYLTYVSDSPYHHYTALESSCPFVNLYLSEWMFHNYGDDANFPKWLYMREGSCIVLIYFKDSEFVTYYFGGGVTKKMWDESKWTL